MSYLRWAIFAGLSSLAFGACGGQDFGVGAGGGNGGSAGAPAEAGGGADSERAGSAGKGVTPHGGSTAQGAAGEPSDASGAAGVAAGAAGVTGAAGAPDLGCDPTAPFGEPVPVLGVANSADDDLSPRLSTDELTIYFARRVINNLAAPTDLYLATRPNIDAPFIDEAKLAISTADYSDGDPMLMTDGATLFFSSDRPNGLGEFDLYQSSHGAPSSPFVSASAVPDVNSPGSEVQPFAATDGELWFAWRKPGSGSALHLRRAPRNGAGYGAPVAVTELDSPSEDNWPVLSRDKLTIYYSSLRTDGGAQGKADIWRAQRRKPTAAFDPPSSVNELNSIASDYAGWLSEDNCRLYLSSNRVTASRGYEIYVAKR